MELEHEEAFTRCLANSERILDRHPHNLIAARNKALALVGLHRWREAELFLLRVVKKWRDDVVCLTTLASVCYDTGQDDKAIEWIAKARKAAGGQNVPQLAYMQGQIDLKNGRYDTGWVGYEYRFVTGMAQQKAPFETLWDGSWLGPDRTLQLWGEQGAGDQVMMARFVKAAKARSGAKVVMCLSSDLTRLLGGFGDTVSPHVDPSVTHCPLFSLPRVFGVMLSDVCGEPYLSVRHDESVASEEDRRGLVGVCWYTSGSSSLFRERDLPREQADRLIRAAGSRYVNLQYGEDGFQPKDFYETAQEIAKCALVVTVDTSVAHIAGAMGIPTWIMLRYQGDFRWLRDREDSPWYNSVKLYRQPKIGDWEAVVTRVERDLECLKLS